MKPAEAVTEIHEDPSSRSLFTRRDRERRGRDPNYSDDVHLMQRLTERSRLDQGEAEAVALASVRRLRVIVDDKEARSVAAASRIEHLGTAGTLLEAYLRKHLDLGELEVTLRNLSEILWISPAVVAEILRLAREAKR